MKQFLNFKVILSLWLFIGMSVVAQAQQSDDEATEARATVVQQIVVSQEADLEFDLVSPGVAKTISHSGPTLVSAGTVTGAEARGVFTVSAGEGTSVDLSYTFPTVLVNATLDELPISFTSGWGEANDNTATDPVTMAGTTNIDEFPAGLVYVMLGGTVTPALSQAPGLYTADVTLTAEYN
ncbi:MAG: DUF4402 domain-containing protein [Saprospiraceae bacterium]|nr:DUF4402 domain-containing protein [Saprospiraceae bacterium]